MQNKEFESPDISEDFADALRKIYVDNDGIEMAVDFLMECLNAYEQATDVLRAKFG